MTREQVVTLFEAGPGVICVEDRTFPGAIYLRTQFLKEATVLALLHHNCSRNHNPRLLMRVNCIKFGALQAGVNRARRECRYDWSLDFFIQWRVGLAGGGGLPPNVAMLCVRLLHDGGPAMKHEVIAAQSGLFAPDRFASLLRVWCRSRAQKVSGLPALHRLLARDGREMLAPVLDGFFRAYEMMIRRPMEADPANASNRDEEILRGYFECLDGGHAMPDCPADRLGVFRCALCSLRAAVMIEMRGSGLPGRSVP